MKGKYQKLSIALFIVALMISCGKKEEKTIIIAQKPEVAEPKTTQRIGDYEQSVDVDWAGSKYQVVVNRVADESLPLADDGTGNKFYDNKIKVNILKNGSTSIFSKTFSKSDFASYLDERAKKNDALLGVVYDRVEGNFAYFAASVGSPDIVGSDEYMPFVVKISRDGSMSISKDTQRDTAGNLETPAIDDDGV